MLIFKQNAIFKNNLELSFEKKKSFLFSVTNVKS